MRRHHLPAAAAALLRIRGRRKWPVVAQGGDNWIWCVRSLCRRICAAAEDAAAALDGDGRTPAALSRRI
jgi:hypothetical protein